MKNIIATGAALLLVSLCNIQAQSVQQSTAVVRFVRGSAQYSNASGVWMPLKVGTRLQSGDSVKTAANSSVDCFLGEKGPVIRVTAGTQLAFDKLAISKADTEIAFETVLKLANRRIL